MTIALWCLLFAAILPYIAIIPSKANRSYDNRLPRQSNAYSEGLAGRAFAAHQNCLEAFPFFAAAIIMATITNPTSQLLGILAVFYIALRILYVGMYYADQPAIRSIVWIAAFFTNISIFILAIVIS